jgi:transposase InsO family protein
VLGVQGFRRVLAALCRAFGVSRQAYYQHGEKILRTKFKVTIVVELVCEIRKRQPRIGGNKLYRLLRRDFIKLDYKLGRDKFYGVLKSEKLLIRPKKRRIKTTDSEHDKPVYPNLIRKRRPRRPFQIIVADITYLRLEESFCYLSLVSDLFSRAIIGWCLAETLEAAGRIRALKEAYLCLRGQGRVIHHSDQGIQYCCHDYVKLLFKWKFRISMTDRGSPSQNAVAERINGTLKTELLLDGTFGCFADAFAATKDAVQIYNHERPHMTLNYQIPWEFMLHYRK